MAEDAFKTEIDRFRASGLLGRPGPLPALFEFLVARTIAGQPPKEIEIALEVFGKDQNFAIGENAVVRVYVHRLRKKLEEFNRRHESPHGFRLEIPKGEYRLTVITAAPRHDEAAEPQSPILSRIPTWAAFAATGVILLFVNIGAWLYFIGGQGLHREVANAPLWHALRNDRFPALIVVGDYYLIGGSDNGIDINRLVREFEINSRDDFYGYLMEHPDKASTYIEVGLSYLPVSVANGLHQLSPLVSRRARTRVVMASELTTEDIKNYNILYLGFLSGMGALREPVFGASRFTIGETYDDLVDSVTGQRYFGSGGEDASAGMLFKGYGYLSTFTGPNGNRIVVISGTRDAALAGMADVVSQPLSLAGLKAATQGSEAYEALYEVRGKGRVNVQSNLILAAPLDSHSIWRVQPQPQYFPPG